MQRQSRPVKKLDFLIPELAQEGLAEESSEEQVHDYRCKKCDGLVDPGDHLEGALTVSLLAVAHWVIAWQRDHSSKDVELIEYVPHWRWALAEVIRQRLAVDCGNQLIESIRSGWIRPDDHWLSLFQQAIECVAESEGRFEATPRPP